MLSLKLKSRQRKHIAKPLKRSSKSSLISIPARMLLLEAMLALMAVAQAMQDMMNLELRAVSSSTRRTTLVSLTQMSSTMTLSIPVQWVVKLDQMMSVNITSSQMHRGIQTMK